MSAYPWDQQDGEPPQWYARFRLWRDTPIPRPNWKDFAETHGLNWGGVRTHAGRWDWKERARAWDELDRHGPEECFDAAVSVAATALALEPAAEQLAAARIKRVELIAAATDLALRGVRSLDVADLKPGDIIALARLVTGFDQQALTINVGDTAVTIDRAALDDLSPEEARRIIEGDIVDA